MELGNTADNLHLEEGILDRDPFAIDNAHHAAFTCRADKAVVERHSAHGELERECIEEAGTRGDRGQIPGKIYRDCLVFEDLLAMDAQINKLGKSLIDLLELGVEGRLNVLEGHEGEHVFQGDLLRLGPWSSVKKDGELAGRH